MRSKEAIEVERVAGEGSNTVKMEKNGGRSDREISEWVDIIKEDQESQVAPLLVDSGPGTCASSASVVRTRLCTRYLRTIGR